MPYDEQYAQFAAQNPGDAYQSPNGGEAAVPDETMGDPLLTGGTQAPAPVATPYAGLTGDPYQTAMVTTAQLNALSPQPRRPRRPTPAPLPFAGLSSYLGA